VKIVNVVGARPNLIKIAPIVREMNRHASIEQLLLHTGQHYDYKMSQVFFEELGLPDPDIYLGVGSASHAVQTAKIMVEFEKFALDWQPNLVLVVGDVNSTLACAITAAKLNIPIAHVEAGLRSFDRDMPGVSNCVDGCAENWPPLTVESEDDLSAAEGIPGTLSTVEREDGSLQVAYNGMPLYYWVQDEAVGDTTGDGRGGVWWIVEPATVYIAGNEELGSFLVGENGFTLYILTADEENSSVCTEQCLENWPALTVGPNDVLVLPEGVMGELSTFERADTGALQVTLNGMPLYYWVNDEAPGDATGQGVSEVWFVVSPDGEVVQ